MVFCGGELVDQWFAGEIECNRGSNWFVGLEIKESFFVGDDGVEWKEVSCLLCCCGWWYAFIVG